MCRKLGLQDDSYRIALWGAIDRLPIDDWTAKAAAVSELGDMELVLIDNGERDAKKIENAVVAAWCATHHCKERPPKNPIYEGGGHEKWVIAYGFLSAIWFCLGVGPVSSGDVAWAAAFAICGAGLLAPYPYFKIAAFVGVFLFLCHGRSSFIKALSARPLTQTTGRRVHWVTTPLAIFAALHAAVSAARKSFLKSARISGMLRITDFGGGARAF